MKRGRSLGFVAIGVVLGLLIVAGPVVAANGSVRIGEANERYFFKPLTTYANVGGSVTWTNGTDVTHNVTSDSGGELDSGAIAQAKTFSHTFAATGTFAYHCTIHTYMVGRVVVLAAGVALPATDTVAGVKRSATDDSIGLVLVMLLGVAGAGLAFRRFRSTI